MSPHDVEVSTGGFIERVLTQGSQAVDRYIGACKDLGFDTVEVCGGFISLPLDDWLRLVDRIQSAVLEAKPEIGLQFGAGGASGATALEAEGMRDPAWTIHHRRRFLQAGVPMLMIESEGITEESANGAVARIMKTLGLEHVMFETADPAVFSWYNKHYGRDINLFVHYGQIVQLECLRSHMGHPELVGPRRHLPRVIW